MRRRGRLRIVPLSGDSSPRIIRNRVVFPAPFGPTNPTRELGRRWADAFSSRTLVEYCLCTDSICSIIPSQPAVVCHWENSRTGDLGSGGNRPLRGVIRRIESRSLRGSQTVRANVIFGGAGRD